MNFAFFSFPDGTHRWFCANAVVRPVFDSQSLTMAASHVKRYPTPFSRQDVMDLVLADDPALAESERREFEVHLWDCDVCRDEYEQSLEVVALLRQYCKLRPNTIELLESNGYEVPEHLRPAEPPLALISISHDNAPATPPQRRL